MPFGIGAGSTARWPTGTQAPNRAPTNIGERIYAIAATEVADRSGSVVATITSTGTVAGREGHRGTVAAAITSTGTATGQEHHFGAVSASTTSSATVAGKEGHRGTATGTVTSTGTAVGQEHHFGTVAASTTVTGTAAGREGHRGTVAASSTVTATVVGTRVSYAVISSTIYSTGVVVGGEHHFGVVAGLVETDGQVTGSKVDPGPDPGPTPAPSGTSSDGPGYMPQPDYAKWYHLDAPRPRPTEPAHRIGRVMGATTHKGRVRARCGRHAAISGHVTSTGCQYATRMPTAMTEAWSAQAARQAVEEHLIVLGVL